MIKVMAADCETPLSLIQKHKKITITGPVLHLHVKVNYFLSYMDTVMLNNEVSVCAAKYSVSDSLFSALSNLERVNMVACYSNLLFDMGGQSEERWSKQRQIAYPRCKNGLF